HPTASSDLLYTLFSFQPPPTSQLSTLSLHDALPISSHPKMKMLAFNDSRPVRPVLVGEEWGAQAFDIMRNLARNVPHNIECLCRSEEHTSELQSRGHLVCRLLLEKKKHNIILNNIEN